MKSFLFYLQMIPSIVALVHTAENVIPGAQQGKAKLDLVLNTVASAAASVPDIAQSISAKDLTSTVQLIANTAVQTLNQAGVFETTKVSMANA